MENFVGRIVDIGPSNAPNGRRRAELHVQALNNMRRHPFNRLAGEALCNPNMLGPDGTYRVAPEEVEPTCSKCIVRMDRYGVRIVVTDVHTEIRTVAE